MPDDRAWLGCSEPVPETGMGAQSCLLEPGPPPCTSAPRPGGKGWKVTLPQQPNLVLSNPQASVSGLHRRQELWTGQGVRKGSRASFLGTPFPDRYSERLLPLLQVQ